MNSLVEVERPRRAMRRSVCSAVLIWALRYDKKEGRREKEKRKEGMYDRDIAEERRESDERESDERRKWKR